MYFQQNLKSINCFSCKSHIKTVTTPIADHPNGVCACSKDHEETSSIKSSPFPLSLCVLVEVNLLQFHVCISSKI